MPLRLPFCREYAFSITLTPRYAAMLFRHTLGEPLHAADIHADMLFRRCLSSAVIYTMPWQPRRAMLRERASAPCRGRRLDDDVVMPLFSPLFFLSSLLSLSSLSRYYECHTRLRFISAMLLPGY